jgi:hypothetical protein
MTQHLVTVTFYMHIPVPDEAKDNLSLVFDNAIKEYVANNKPSVSTVTRDAAGALLRAELDFVPRSA